MSKISFEEVVFFKVYMSAFTLAYFGALPSVSLVCMSAFCLFACLLVFAIITQFGYYGSTAQFEIRYCDTSSISYHLKVLRSLRIFSASIWCQ